MTVVMIDPRRLPPAGEVHEVAIVSTSELVRAGLSRMLGTMPAVRVTRCVESLVLLPTGAFAPGIAIVDVHPLGGRWLTDRFWSMIPAGTRVVLMCRTGEVHALGAAVRAGVRAFVTRDCDAGDLSAAIEAAARGGLHVSADLLEDLVQPADDPGTRRTTRLGDREVETLRLVAEGLTHGQISRRMGLTEATVSTYVKRIRTKLNAANKAELTLRAVELGYVTPAGGDTETGTRRAASGGARLASIVKDSQEAM